MPDYLDSHWPPAVIKLRRPQYTDGYETVWFYQPLSAACSKHGQALNAGI